MLNAVCAFLRSPFLSLSSSLPFILWMVGWRKKKELSNIWLCRVRCMHDDDDDDDAITCMRFLHYIICGVHLHSINSNSLNHRCQFDSGCPHAKLCVHHHLNDLNYEKKTTDRQYKRSNKKPTCTHMYTYRTIFFFHSNTKLPLMSIESIKLSRIKMKHLRLYEKFFFSLCCCWIHFILNVK